MKAFVEKISSKAESPLPAPLLPKLEDEIFGEMLVKMLAAVEDSEEKYLLKMHIQQDIVQTRYVARRISLQQNNIQYHSRNSSFMSP